MITYNIGVFSVNDALISRIAKKKSSNCREAHIVISKALINVERLDPTAPREVARCVGRHCYVAQDCGYDASV